MRFDNLLLQARSLLFDFSSVIRNRNEFEMGPQGYLQTANSLHSLGRTDEAIPLLAEAAEKFPDKPHLLVRLGQFQNARGQSTAGLTTGRTLIDRFPQLPGSYLQTANSLHSLGRTDEAIPLLAEAVEKFPENPQLLVRLGEFQNARNRFTEAADTGRKLIERFPQVQGSYIQTANILHGQGRTDEALPLLAKAADRFPENPQFLVRLGQIQNEIKRGALAEETAQKLRILFPRSPHISGLLGESLMVRGKYADAKPYLYESVSKHPNLYRYFHSYTKLILALHENDQKYIIKELESFIKHHPNQPEPYYFYFNYLVKKNIDSDEAYKLSLRLRNHFSKKGSLDKELIKYDLMRKEKDADNKNKNYRNIEKIIQRDRNDQLNFIDADSYDFSELTKSNEPLIGLFAYSRPYTNLDQMYYLSKLLIRKGKKVIFFLKKEDIEYLDFSEIEIDPDDKFFVCWTDFLYSVNFLNCIVTNDMCGINPKYLQEGCKLVFHSPHNTKKGYDKIQDARSHVSTFLKKEHTANDIICNKVSISPKQVCLIPNTYSKNEILYDFIKTSDHGVKSFSFCPTSFNKVMGALKRHGNDQLYFEKYVSDVIEMVQELLNNYNDHYFIYRPFWGHSTHYFLTDKLISAFDKKERFLVDDNINSKYTLAMSDILITDESGIGITFSEVKNRRHIRFIPEYLEAAFHDEKETQKFITCHSPSEVLRAADEILRGARHSNFEGANNTEERPDIYSGASYFVDNIDYIIKDLRHPDWKYFDLE